MNRLCTVWLIGLTTLFGIADSLRADEGGKVRVYFGTYTNETTKGIYLSIFDAATGKLTPPELAVESKSPSFVAIHPTRKFVYAVSEISDFQGMPVGAVSAFSVDLASGKLTLLNQQPSAGAGPCHLVVDAAGKNVLVANYGGGTVAALPINADGHLAAPSSFMQHRWDGVNKQRQDARAHSINLDAANKFAFGADAGLDKIFIYHFDSAKGLLTVNDPPAGLVAPGSGPRHFAFHPSGKFAFTNNETTSSVTAFTYDPVRGALTEIHTLSTLPEPTPGNSTAEIVVHPSGKFVYVSNRGHDSLAMFRCDESTGRLSVIGHQPSGGKTPRNFNIDPSGRYILAANQSTNNVVVMSIDADTGKLTPTGQSIDVGSPVCIRFMLIDK